MKYFNSPLKPMVQQNNNRNTKHHKDPLNKLCCIRRGQAPPPNLTQNASKLVHVCHVYNSVDL